MENKYIAYIEKSSSFIGGAIATHLIQNGITNAAIKSPRIAKHLANSFSEGAHGVHNSSLSAKAIQAALGVISPDIAVAHKTVHELGRSMKPILDKTTPRQKVGIRMLTQGRFDKLKKHGFDKDPVVLEAHRHLSKHLPIPSMNNIVAHSNALEKAWKNEKTPLLSNISYNISRGHKPVGNHFRPGELSSVPIIGGAIGSALIDPTAGIVNTSKSLLANKKIANNRYGKKITEILNKNFIKDPIKKGWKTGEDFADSIKNKLYHFGVNPMSGNLKRTSANLAEALKKKFNE